MGGRGYDGFRTAVAYFEQAIARQPDFAGGCCGHGRRAATVLCGGPLSPRESDTKAEASVREALQLDDTLASAHRTLGTS